MLPAAALGYTHDSGAPFRHSEAVMPKLGSACLYLVVLLLACQPLHAAPAGESEPTYHGKNLKEWIELARDDRPTVRLRAVRHLGLGPFGKRAVPAVCAALRDEKQDVRSAAVRALGNLGRDAGEAVP